MLHIVKANREKVSGAGQAWTEARTTGNEWECLDIEFN
jgi:hypothetical protein